MCDQNWCPLYIACVHTTRLPTAALCCAVSGFLTYLNRLFSVAYSVRSLPSDCHPLVVLRVRSGMCVCVTCFAAGHAMSCSASAGSTRRVRVCCYHVHGCMLLRRM